MNKNLILLPEIKNYSDQINELFPEFIHANDSPIIKTITFQVTEDCCLQCTYCYQHNKTQKKMNFDTAKIFIDKMLNNEYSVLQESDYKGIIVEFIGGEPFLAIDLIRQIWEYLFNQMVIKQHSWLPYTMMSICTNGVLYQTDKVQQFLQDWSPWIDLCISIDGNKQLHDKCRIDKQGKGSYDLAIAAAHHYQQVYNQGQMPATKMTLSPENINYTYEAIINLIKEGYTQIHANCVFEEGWTIEHAKIFYIQLKQLADYLLENKIYKTCFISLFNDCDFTPLPEEEDKNWCGGTNCTMLAISPDGTFYPCLRYMPSSLGDKQEPLDIGTVNEDIDINNSHLQQTCNITRKSQSTEECFNCPVAKGCSWCSAYNYERFGDVNHRATFICDMHKARALANYYYWTRLYKQENIMDIYPLYLSDFDIQKIKGE